MNPRAAGGGLAPPLAGAPGGPVPVSLGLAWASGTLGLALLFNSVHLLMLRWMTDWLGIAAAVAGLLLAGAKVCDALLGPLVGLASDRTRSRYGRRRPYLLWCGLLCATVLPALFWLPAQVPAPWLVPALAFGLLLHAAAYTGFNVPYLATAAEMRLDYHQRSSLMSYRVGAIGLGQVLAAALAPMLVLWCGGGRDGHAGMAFALAAVVLLACWTPFLHLREHASARPHGAGSLRAQLRLAFDDRPFALLLGTRLLQLMGLAATQASLAFFATHVLRGGDALLAALYATLTLAMVAALPLWLSVSRALGKPRSYQLGAVVYALASLGWLGASATTPLPVLLAIAALAGLGSGGMLLAAQSLLPDAIAWDRYRTGLAREGLYAGLYSTVEKLAFALGLALTGTILGASGYVAGTSGGAVVQDAAVVRAIYACVAVLPALGALAGAALLQAWELDEARVRLAAARAGTRETTGC